MPTPNWANLDGPVWLKRPLGLTRYDSIQEFISKVRYRGWIIANLSGHPIHGRDTRFPDQVPRPYPFWHYDQPKGLDFGGYHPYNLIDQHGLIIPVWRVLRAFDEHAEPVDNWFWSRRDRGGYRYRCGPVPGVRCRRGARYGKRAYRYPQTLQEIKANKAFVEDLREYDWKIRGRRRDLRDCRDEIGRHDYTRSWKAHRRTQYHPD